MAEFDGRFALSLFRLTLFAREFEIGTNISNLQIGAFAQRLAHSQRWIRQERRNDFRFCW